MKTATTSIFGSSLFSQRDLEQRGSVRLFCLPHAGSGAAAFYRWRRQIEPAIAVCPVLLPGRESRLAEPCVRSISLLTDALMHPAAQVTDRPYAIFGHSMGALVGWCWAVALERAGWPAPRCLIVSGRNAPEIVDERQALHLLDEGDFVAHLDQRYGGHTSALLEDPELRDLFLPVLRADLELVASYKYEQVPQLGCPIVAVAGWEDPSVSELGLRAWGSRTDATFELKRFPGDHFFQLGTAQPALLQFLTEMLVPQSR